MWNKCEVTFSINPLVPDDLESDRVRSMLNGHPGLLPEGWALHRVDPVAHGYDLVFRIEGLNLTYEAGRHVQRSLERLRLR